MAYEYDVFLSYTRTGTGRWVREHLYPALTHSLENAMPRQPRVFVDWQQESGTVWPENLANALQTSRVMVPVFSPPYFRSAWCRTELATIAHRERLLELGTRRHPQGLTHPVIFADGKHFPPEAQRLQGVSLIKWGVDMTYEGYSKSPAYVGFLKAVRAFAITLADRIERVPAWQPDWPVVEAEPLPEVRAELPRLWGTS
ncbi:hypothetical protein BJ973_000682 [Actinoplanes tereljensis]|uniref:TIR domain-containing protein n=1 Tax=Paractinoplanes tereljensis TaxID=571912 RepID=A0A919NQ29_9ACTN|nr:toll/interleukin-1 receptor domain-containing protein [Actinoplanes tereljensis]GIF22960.1 hypothetical protein Ate02nite_56900 [Actinoplanes tereljensis]